MHEAPLPGGGGRAAESCMRIERREQREAQSGDLCGGHDAPCELRRIVIGLARGVMMHVMEFGDARVPCLRHLDVGLRGDRLERLGIDAIEEGVQRLAPGPEVVFVPGRCLPRGPASARWNACECKLGIAGTTGPWRTAQPSARIRLDGDNVAGLIDIDGDGNLTALGQQRAWAKYFTARALRSVSR